MNINKMYFYYYYFINRIERKIYKTFFEKLTIINYYLSRFWEGIHPFQKATCKNLLRKKQKLSTHPGQMLKPMCEAKYAGTDEPTILGIWVRSEGMRLKSLVQEKHNYRLQADSPLNESSAHIKTGVSNPALRERLEGQQMKDTQ